MTSAMGNELLYTNSRGSGEPAYLCSLASPTLFANISHRPRVNFIQRTRHVVLPMSWACALKD